MMAALAEVAAGGSQQQWRIEFEVEDQPFWWDNNLGDADVRRMFGAVPPNAQVRFSSVTTCADCSQHMHWGATKLWGDEACVAFGAAPSNAQVELTSVTSSESCSLLLTHTPRWP